MAWFKSELLSACSEEKSEKNQLILMSLASTLLSVGLIGLLQYSQPCRFGDVYADATGGLPIKSEYVRLLLH
jgi:hypothetical protein